MTIVKPVQIQVAHNVFEAWDKLGVTTRAERLEKALLKLGSKQASMAKWQLDNARHEIANPMVMPGPTGESNVLATQGRGVFLTSVHCDDASDNVTLALVGQIFAALVAGNTVITVGSRGQSLMDIVAAEVPQGVIQNVADSAEDSIIEAEGLAGIATVCDIQYAIQLNERLAQKDGLICQLVAETDIQSLSSVAMPRHILRFVTERAVTTNTTAIGGNATLLELGSMSE